MPNIRKVLMGAAGVSKGPKGELWAWGTNWRGEQGQGDDSDPDATHRSVPTQVGALTDWKTPVIGAMDRASGCIKDNGTLWCWGNNDYGQLGFGNTTNICSPAQVGSLTTWFNNGAGDYHQVAIKTDGSLWSWGRTHYGQGGRNNSTDISSPAQIGSLTDWKGVTAEQLEDGYPVRLGVGSYNVIIIKDDGTLWSWGWGAQKTGGWGDTDNRSSPVQIGSGTDWQSVASNFSYNTLAIKTNGTLYAWGKGDYGQLGQGDTTDHDSPVQVGSLTTWKYLGAGYGFAHMVKTDGTLWFMGRNDAGQGGTGNLTNYSSPVQIGSDTDWAQVVDGYEHMRVLKTDGTLWVSGKNNYGQLGQNNTTELSSPVQVGTVTRWSKMICGKTHTVIVQ